MAADEGSLNLMLYGTGAAASLSNAYTQGAAASSQGRYEAAGLRWNARMAELNAGDAIARGQLEAVKVGRSARRLQGSQRAAFAAQGVDVSTGSAADIVAETGQLAQEDIRTITNNAWREAFGFKAEALQLEAKARMAKVVARYEKTTTLATGGMSAARELLKGYRAYKYPDKVKAE